MVSLGGKEFWDSLNVLWDMEFGHIEIQKYLLRTWLCNHKVPGCITNLILSKCPDRLLPYEDEARALIVLKHLGTSNG